MRSPATAKFIARLGPRDAWWTRQCRVACGGGADTVNGQRLVDEESSRTYICWFCSRHTVPVHASVHACPCQWPIDDKRVAMSAISTCFTHCCINTVTNSRIERYCVRYSSNILCVLESIRAAMECNIPQTINHPRTLSVQFFFIDHYKHQWNSTKRTSSLSLALYWVCGVSLR